MACYVEGSCFDTYTEDAQLSRIYSNLTQVPTDIPNEARHVYLYENKITTLKAEAFSNLNNCVLLDVQHNQISNIETGTFTGLAKVTTLDLQYNKMTEMGPKNVERTSISDNVILKLESN